VGAKDEPREGVSGEAWLLAHPLVHVQSQSTRKHHSLQVPTVLVSLFSAMFKGEKRREKVSG
jgi:hypothetical protein